MNLESYLERRRKLINRLLQENLPEESGLANRLRESMRYSLFVGGKRIRPILLLAATEAVGGAVEPAYPFACGIEMIHTYSLIHDDLPCMDDDSLRRGKPTNHTVYGEALAVLAGDALLTDAFAIMSRSLGRGASARRALAALAEIAQAAGSKGMVAGQCADMAAEHTEPDLPTVEFIHVRKTGALLRAAVRAGAILGGARPTQLRAITRYGECVGLAFQVADDILDAVGSTAETGKVGGRDADRRKVTFPAVMGLHAAREQAASLVESALDALAGFDKSVNPLRQIAKLIVTRTDANQRAFGLEGPPH